ncbi:MAG: Tad domain-containing protein [Acidimicrobiales bacterium]|nr:Tad domain-containing protein [Acidimicrobiales bacterium]
MALMGLIMIPLMAFVALATDVGAWYAEATKIQRAADAAALAGVVWMPDITQAESVARDVARRNGYVDTGTADSRYTIEVIEISGQAQQLAVRITDHDAPIYFAELFIDNMEIARQAISEYVLPVPMGSPKNHIGTGDLIGGNPEGYWLAINGFCSASENGDARASRFSRNYRNSGGWGNEICPDAASTANPQLPMADSPGRNAGHTPWSYNPQFDGEDTYEYYVEIPDVAGTGLTTQEYEIYILDPSHQNAGYELSGWTTYNQTQIVHLRAADGTPLDDSDNPDFDQCGELSPGPERNTGTKQFLPDTNYNNSTVLGVNDWYRFCTIPIGSPTGRYILSMSPLIGEITAVQVNFYALLAKVKGAGDICDTRTTAADYTADCPGVYAKEYLGIMADAGSTAEFFLAEITNQHEGKELRITLFDSGERGDWIEILDPNGNRVSFDWRILDDPLNVYRTNRLDATVQRTIYPGEWDIGSNQTYRFNDRYVELTIDLPPSFETAYGAGGSRWWKVRYKFFGDATDRTTWSVAVIGDPVRLVE